MSDETEQPTGLKRRDFLKLVGITTAATAGAGCLEFPPPPQTLYPYVTPPENVIPGVATYYATTCRECPAGCGLHVKTREGRAIKLEGNPNHPVNQGKLCPRGQAALHGLYNPDRWTAPMVRESGGALKKTTWEEGLRLLAEKLKARTGAVQFWTGQETGTRQIVYDAFVSALAPAERIAYEPFAWEAVREGNRLSFGNAQIPTYDFEAAATVFTFGADFLETWISPVEYARQFAASHGGDASKGRMVAFEPRMSLTGSNADEWVAILPGTEAIVALAMAHEIVAAGLAKGPTGGVDLTKYAADAVAAQIGVPADVLKRLAREFASKGPALAVAGGIASQGPKATEAVVAANILTSVAGGVGTTIHFGKTLDLGTTHSVRDAAKAIDALNAGQVGVLLVHGTDPAYSLPAGLKFAEAAKKAAFKVSFSSYPDDTSQLCDLILPDHHPLESWGDHRGWTGVSSMIQPAMRPVFDTMSTPDVLYAIAVTIGKNQGVLAAPGWLAELKGVWSGDDWDTALQNGGVFQPLGVTRGGALSASGGGALDFAPVALQGDAGGMPLVVYASPNLYDGRGANKPWLQELPDPVTKVVWDSWLEMHPDTAKKLGYKRGDHISVKTAAGTIETAVYDYIGIRPDVFAIGTGQGHLEYGQYARKRGANVLAALPLVYDQSGALAYVSTRAQIAKTGKPYYLAWLGGDPYTGGQQTQMGRGIAQAIPLTEIGKPLSHEEEAEEAMHKEGFKGAMVPADPIAHAAKEAPNSAYAHFANHKWAMIVDLNSCTGCQACIVACSAENNVAMVGKEQINKGRDMMWLRLERYYEEVDGRLDVRHIPVMCQQCGAAPCESVCPVYATYHNPEGLNAMIYNRCVGTRYCSNNCPYKVRSFNWYSFKFPAPLHWQLNPDVTVRDKGVMEKCTFCIQRIRVAKDTAKDEARKVKDGDVKTACQQTCPSQAILFGDLMDPESEVAKHVNHDRGYKMLGDLNTHPSVTYLKKVTRTLPA
jgi:anaerobic selenocysteine-containing dehydrogenase/Fe-S-cluster-containing dehydrogenase component